MAEPKKICTKCGESGDLENPCPRTENGEHRFFVPKSMSEFRRVDFQVRAKLENEAT